MLAAELVGVRKLRVAEISNPPDPGPGEVQVRVRAVGICGSDLHCYWEGGIGDTPCIFPMVLGHEPAGEVLRAGAGVTGLEPGMAAALEPAIYCGRCEYCLAGRQNVCERIRFLSNPGEPGFFREVINLPAANVTPLPRTISMEEAVLHEPLAVALNAMRLADLRPGETAAVFGAGPIGLLTMAAARLCGAGRIYAVDRIPARLELARQVGADCAIDFSAVPPDKAILAETSGRGVDVAFEAAGKAEAINHCLRVARNAGRVVLIGIPAELSVPVEFHGMRRKELALFNVRRQNRNAAAAIWLLVERRLRAGEIVTHTRPLESIAAAFQLLENYDDGVGKAVITMK
ncbi:MAG TPA: alcohol dehydrogenase catalytic domain-containing protein [Bryobacterales bacterium]|jgi:L-iditol 2-dehydrogenase|nr:alcohol dehydrogenase catalytic domain-containing protein [Bryobacterales bacterium]